VDRADALFQKSHRCYYPNRRLRMLQAAILRQAERTGRIARVLDVGCGPGVLGEWLRTNDIEYVGVEIDTEYCAYAQRHGIDVREVDLRTRPALGQFDVVVMSEVFEHLEDGFEALAGLRKYVRPGGVLLLTVPSLSLFRRFKHALSLRGVQIAEDEHVREFAPAPIRPADDFWVSYAELCQGIRDCGYGIQWRRGVGAFDFPRGLKTADWLFRRIGPLLLDALDWCCDFGRGVIGCRYLCLALKPSQSSAP